VKDVFLLVADTKTRHHRSGGSCEADLSTKQYQAEAQPRIPCAHEFSSWPQGAQPSPSQGPQTSCAHNKYQEGLTKVLVGLSVWQSKMRLRKRCDFRRVQGRGRRIRLSSLMLLYLPGQSTQTRIGLTVSKKVGCAVVRNRVKRWLRESLRKQYNQIDGTWDVVVIAHPSAARSGQEKLQQQLIHGLTSIREYT